MKIIFFGSDEFAATHMEALIRARHDVVACVTQPDKPKGRGMDVSVSPVKKLGEDNNIPVLQPYSLSNSTFIKELSSFNPELFVVIAYGKFLPDEMLAIPPKGSINVHGSLLPKLRGAGPINWAIINGDKETGVTVARITSKMDAGNILLFHKIAIYADDDAITLRREMLKIGPNLLIKTIKLLSADKYREIPQDESKVTFAPKLTKELGNIEWEKPAVEINNFIRGLVPWPNAYTFYNGKLLKIFKAKVVRGDKTRTPGEVVKVDRDSFVVQTGKDALLIKEVHLQDSKRMSVKEFLLGRKIEAGIRFSQG